MVLTFLTGPKNLGGEPITTGSSVTPASTSDQIASTTKSTMTILDLQAFKTTSSIKAKNHVLKPRPKNPFVSFLRFV